MMQYSIATHSAAAWLAALAISTLAPASAATNEGGSLPASGQFTFTQSFYSTAALDQTNPPAKLLVTFDVAKYRAAYPNGTGTLWRQKTLGPNYRIDLTCGA